MNNSGFKAPSSILQTFFEKFELFADAQNAVSKMRELILEFAAQGKLVAQSEDDEPASELVKRINQHFGLLRDQKALRDPPIEPLDTGDLPVLPLNWEWVPLGNVVAYGSSDKVTSTEISDDSWILDLEDIEKNTSRIIQRKTFRVSQSKSTKASFHSGDVLYGKLRPYLNKVVVADSSGFCTTEIIPIRTFGFINPEYLCYALKRPDFISYATSKSYGMNLPRLGTEDARRAPFPLPPLAEQKRIVAKVDELMGLCDRLEAQQKERAEKHAALARAALARFAEAPTPANLDFLFHEAYPIPPADLRKSIYQAAFDGFLTSHPQQALSLGLVPTGWELREIASLCEIEDGDRGSAYPKKEDFSESGYCVFLNTKNVRIHGFDFTTLEWISEGKHKQLRKGKLIRGDIVFTSRGTIGNIAHYDESVPFDVMRINSGMFILRGFEKDMEATFLSRLLRAPQIRNQIESLQSGSAQPQLPIREFRKFVAKIPPLAEQRRIVAKVDQLMALVDQLETQLADSRTTATKLLEAIVTELTQSR